MHGFVRPTFWGAAFGALVLSSACSAGGENTSVTGASTSGSTAGAMDITDAGATGGGDGSESTGTTGAAGDNTTGAEADAGEPKCDMSLRLTVRDFTEDHPDFESFGGNSLRGIVAEDLGADKKPVYANAGPTAVNTGKAEFDQWYRDTPGVNMTLSVDLEFTEETAGVFVYDNSAFFPADGMGFGNGPNSDGFLGIGGSDAEHNFLFTTEAHTLFTYQGGEEFTFRGDDDLWVFINDKLAVDLGGVHGAEMSTISLDAEAARLGITVGETYSMDIFHAERHTDESNYRIETTIDLSCIQNVPII